MKRQEKKKHIRNGRRRRKRKTGRSVRREKRREAQCIKQAKTDKGEIIAVTSCFYMTFH